MAIPAPPRWPLYVALAAYTLGMKLLPYALPLVGVPIDHTLNSYPWNFSPVLAFCLYGGATLPRRSLSLGVPVLVWLLGDLGIWALTGRRDWAFYPAQGVVYAGLLVCAACGGLLRCDRTWWGVAGLALLAPCVFTLLTNGGCWLTNADYPRSLQGLWQCYGDGLTHHLHLTLSTLLFSGCLFSPLGIPAATRADDLQPATVT